MSAFDQYANGAAHFSDDRAYRYALSRVWTPEKPMLMFVGLNPSTADEMRLDPTLRRVVSFALRENFGGIWVGNLFAYRATQPDVMLRVDDPVGPLNDRWLLDMARWCETVLCGWGAHGGHRGRDREVSILLRDYHLQCLGRTQGGHPRHPLYLRRDTRMFDYAGPFTGATA